MDRHFARTAAAVFCVAWLGACSSTDDKANAPTTAAQPQPKPQTAQPDNYPATLDGEIAHAQKLRAEGSYDDAAKVLAQLMIVAPDDVRVVGNYGKVLTQLGRPDEAIPFLTRAVQLDGNDWTLYSALGVAYDQADQHQRAHAAYEHALKLKPGEPGVLNNMGVSKMLSGNLGDAQKLLTEAQQPGTEPKVNNNLALLETMEKTPATRGPKPLSGVVMQKVPTDPDKGPQHKATPHKVARTPTHKPDPAPAPALRKQDQTPPAQPVLRTADGQ